jgi:DNA phosphorothioation-dependent restriction protein DptH
MNIFSDSSFDWCDVIYDPGKITVYELQGLEAGTKKIILEFLLWDLWAFASLKGLECKPFVTVFDECQNLSYKSGSPVSKILTEGRKFGFCGIFITQFLNARFDKETIGLLEQCATNFYFRPPDEEIRTVAKKLSYKKSDMWMEYLEKLSKGKCVVRGFFESKLRPGETVEYPPVIIRIPSL